LKFLFTVGHKKERKRKYAAEAIAEFFEDSKNYEL